MKYTLRFSKLDGRFTYLPRNYGDLWEANLENAMFFSTPGMLLMEVSRRVKLGADFNSSSYHIIACEEISIPQLKVTMILGEVTPWADR